MECANDGGYSNYCDISKWVSIYELATVFRKLVDFHSFVYRFLGATHYLFHQHHYILALLFAFTQLLFAFFGQETLLFVFETFSSFGNIFVFGMLIFSIAFYLQQYFYMQNKNKE